MHTLGYSPYTTPVGSPFGSPKASLYARVGLNLRTLSKLAVAVFFCFYLAFFTRWKKPVPANLIISELLASNFTLTRAPAAVNLEQLVDSSPMLGICYQQKALLQGIPDSVCQKLQVGMRVSSYLCAGFVVNRVLILAGLRACSVCGWSICSSALT